jgi:histidine triad (HIT) family protein
MRKSAVNTGDFGMGNQTYDDNNVFAKILRGELPAHRIYEDETTLAFMDIMPRGNGHSLVIPKAPCRNILDADPAVLGAVIETVQRVAKASMRVLSADGLTIQQFNEPAGGQEVYHLHFHVIPRFDGVKLGPPGIMGDMETIKAYAGKIRDAVTAHG